MNKKNSEERREQARESIAVLLRAREHVYRGLAEVLKPQELTEPKFNALRILRGAGDEGLPTLEVGSRMITHIPDITRLLDRLESEGLVSRERCPVDRRIVRAKLTAKARRGLKKLDTSMDEFNVKCMSSLSDAELNDLTRLLKRISAKKK